MNAKSVREGVEEAFAFWLSQHDVSTPECVIEGVKQAASEWMERHTNDLVAEIASRVQLDDASEAVNEMQHKFLANLSAEQKPQERAVPSATDPRADMGRKERIIAFCAAHPASGVAMEVIAKVAGISRRTLYRLMADDPTIEGCIRLVRGEKARLKRLEDLLGPG